jgi:hypothetical protein
MRFLAPILCLAAMPQPVQAEVLPVRRAVEAVAALSNDDPAAIAAARRMLRGGPATGSMFADLPADMWVFAIVAASLEASGRLVSLDWKEEASEAEAGFERLFAKAGVSTTGVADRIESIARRVETQGVGLAYAAYREAAEAGGYRILGLNAGSDMYHFVLVRQDRAARWQGVRLGPDQYVEDSDWQFRDVLEAIGVTPRSTAHPAATPIR